MAESADRTIQMAAGDRRVGPTPYCGVLLVAVIGAIAEYVITCWRG